MVWVVYLGANSTVAVYLKQTQNMKGNVGKLEEEITGKWDEVEGRRKWGAA